MKPQPARTEQSIRELAKQTLIDHGLYAIPVNPVTLANRLGIRVFNAVFYEPKFSGLTAKRGDAATILINQNDAPVRKRFTVAHELGHSLLHMQDGTAEIIDTDTDFYRTSETPDEGWTVERRREYEANNFASELLMPQELVVQAWRDLPVESRTVENMAKLFQVSDVAMGYRLDKLGLI